jgi:hypothetical protein
MINKEWINQFGSEPPPLLQKREMLAHSPYGYLETRHRNGSSSKSFKI